jgi:hypothetical protein
MESNITADGPKQTDQTFCNNSVSALKIPWFVLSFAEYNLCVWYIPYSKVNPDYVSHAVNVPIVWIKSLT